MDQMMILFFSAVVADKNSCFFLEPFEQKTEQISSDNSSISMIIPADNVLVH